MGEGGFTMLFLAIGAIGVATLVGPIGQLIARRLGGEKRGNREAVNTGEMAAERLGALEGRVAELEERLDFAERLLAQADRATPELPGSLKPGASHRP
jgi:hypothetical protein